MPDITSDMLRPSGGGYRGTFFQMKSTSLRDDSAPFACVLNAWGAHESELKGYLVHRVADPHLAEELLQEVFFRALRQGQAFCNLDNPRAWLFQVARNALVDHLRQAKDAVPLPEDLIQEEQDIAPVDALAGCLDRALSELTEHDRDIIRQCDLERVKLQTFADSHGLSLPAVKSRIQRARQRMRELITRNCQVRFDEAGQVCCHVPRDPD